MTADARRRAVVRKSLDYDELYAEWFLCPLCKNDNLLHIFNFCPNCGAQLDWGKFGGR